MPDPNVIRNKYHGCVVQQVLTDKGWDISLFKINPEGGETFLKKCGDVSEAIAEAKKAGTVLPPVQRSNSDHGPRLEAVGEDADGDITVEIKV